MFCQPHRRQQLHICGKEPHQLSPVERRLDQDLIVTCSEVSWGNILDCSYDHVEAVLVAGSLAKPWGDTSSGLIDSILVRSAIGKAPDLVLE